MSDPREWPAEYVDYVKLLAAEQLSAAMIAQRMNERFSAALSRNSIIGKLRRLGVALVGAKSAEIGARVSAAKRKRNAEKRASSPPRRGDTFRARAWAHRATMELVPDIPPDEFDNAIPPEQRKQVVDLKNCHCRWPVGDPQEANFFYCGSPTADLTENRPYCAVHARRARGTPRVSARDPWRSIGQAARTAVEAL